jgi:hypothetical protein
MERRDVGRCASRHNIYVTVRLPWRRRAWQPRRKHREMAAPRPVLLERGTLALGRRYGRGKRFCGVGEVGVGCILPTREDEERT